MQNNPVIEAIYAAFQLEIANQFTLTDHALMVTLPDQNCIAIRAPQVTASATNTAPTTDFHTTRDAHTYHYIHQHNFTTDTKHPLPKLLLHNGEECRAYLDDICHTFLNATIRDNEITFPDSTTYLVMLDPA